MEKDDSKLILEYLNGDENSFRDLVLRYLKPIYNFSLRMTGNKNDSEDIVQDVFLKVWKNLKKYDERAAFKTWIFTIARNTIFDYLRKNKELIFSDLENDNDEISFEENIVDEDVNIEESFFENEILENLKEGIEKLSKKDKEILFLRYEDGITFEEISKILEKPLNTVKSDYRRALLRLKKLIAPK